MTHTSPQTPTSQKTPRGGGRRIWGIRNAPRPGMHLPGAIRL